VTRRTDPSEPTDISPHTRINSDATKKSADRRKAILQAAAEIFDRKGYSNTSLDDIAHKVGIKREAVYYYYRNRVEILLAIIEPQSVALLKGLDQILEMDTAAVEKLKLAVQNHLKRFDRYCLEMTVSLRDGLIETRSDAESLTYRNWKKYENGWVRLISDGQKSGDFSSGGDAKMLAFGILGMCNWLARWYDPKESWSLDSIIGNYFDLIAFGLASPDNSARKLREKRT